MSQTTFPTAPEIDIKYIIPDPNQPRHYYDEQAMIELVSSVSQQGVFQPVLLRPLTETKIKDHRKAKYMIVCGERRYRASITAGAKTIPATIRVLTDEQALEIQIMENLQRENVQPMEEATAFKSLQDQHKFDITEIAHRVGKSATYVAQRLKLNDLVPGFQEMLFQNKLMLKDAMQLCRLDGAGQKGILENVAPKDWNKRKDWQMTDNINYYIKEELCNLGDATFKTEDPLLYQEAGTCGNCRFNSANNPLLFEDLNKKRICHNSLCFKIKTERAYEQKIKSVASNPEILFVSTKGYLDKEDNQSIEKVKDLGRVVIASGDIEIVSKPEPVDDWDTFLKNADDWENDKDEEDTEEDRQAYIASIKEDFETEVADYNQELEEYNNQIASGLIKKAFVVCGYSDKGKTVDVIVTDRKQANIANGNSEETALLKEEITQLEDKEKRNKELDREKIYAQVADSLAPVLIQKKDPLQKAEWIALVIMLAEYSYKTRVWAHSKIGSDTNDYNHIELFQHLNDLDSTAFSDFTCNMIRVAMNDKMVNKIYGDWNKYGKAAAMMKVAHLWITKTVVEISTDQEHKSGKRSCNIQKQIDAIQSKINATENPAPAISEPEIKDGKWNVWNTDPIEADEVQEPEAAIKIPPQKSKKKSLVDV